MDPIKLTTYFAIQIESQETSHDVTRLVFETAKNIKASFHTLEAMDTISFGSATLVRFRTDLGDANPLLDRLAENGRSIIRAQSGVFMLKLADGRHGLVPASKMLVSPNLGHNRVYRGTASKLWEQQFVTGVSS